MIEFDQGPPSDFAEHFSQVPDYAPFKEHFWYPTFRTPIIRN